ncbi:MAG: GxxExxY protein [Bacteroidota bacterium]|nr:GxxExxY protein [Flavisolibacter sp.]MDQ3844564.1 GxxExxY protein [Bacteroidota bacterium]MBD0287273.1 GxxExxY protein [Flavisolibacter sp.]MBD0297952.1 GxxExxY protein [Flavisolibacter sp.]MBD0353075.1 GxxExxY protein [Flavisolibacter sp.]
MELNNITGQIVDAAIKVHNELGPGLFESVYEEILAYELQKRRLFVERQVPVPVYYDYLKMEVGFRADLIVEKQVIVEIKSIETIAPVHKKQVLTYLRLTGLKIGLLINFNEELLKNGITRLINNYVK